MILWPQRNRALAHPSIHPNVLAGNVYSRIREEEKDKAAHFLRGAAPMGWNRREDGVEKGGGHCA